MTTRIPTTGRKLAAAVALLTATTLLGTACTAQPPPSSASASGSAAETASAGPSETPSATPTPTASYRPADAKGRAQNVPVPVMPAAAKAKTKEGLEAFARYWFEQLNYAYETGKTNELSATTAQTCELCSNLVGAVKHNYQGDRWLVGGKIAAAAISTKFDAGTDGNYQVVVQVQQSKISYFAPDRSQFRAPTPPSDTGNIMLSAFRNGAWQVTGLHPIR